MTGMVGMKARLEGSERAKCLLLKGRRRSAVAQDFLSLRMGRDLKSLSLKSAAECALRRNWTALLMRNSPRSFSLALYTRDFRSLLPVAVAVSVCYRHDLQD